MVKWVTKYCDPVMATGWHMVLGSLPLIALSIAQEGTQLQERLPQLTGPPPPLLSSLVLFCTLPLPSSDAMLHDIEEIPACFPYPDVHSPWALHLPAP